MNQEDEKRHSSHHHHKEHSAGMELTKDPVCGMEVNPHDAEFKYSLDNAEYYFCSTHCLESFQKEPKKFLVPSASKEVSKPTTSAANKKNTPVLCTQKFCNLVLAVALFVGWH